MQNHMSYVVCMFSVGVQPRQDPGGTLGMNSFGERERHETSLDRAKSQDER